MKIKCNILSILFLSFLFNGCAYYDEDIPNKLVSLIKTTEEPQGINCSTGGTKIETGLDSNCNGILEESEVTSTAFICNGRNGMISTTKTTNLPAGAECATGGSKVETGIDFNNNGILDTNEISSTVYLCNGNIGSNGNNGTNALIKSTVISAGGNCSEGGIKLEIGLDLNANAVLDAIEVQSTQLICNGHNGATGKGSLIKSTTIPPGVNCTEGGTKLEVGIDQNGNAVLDVSEIQNTQFICNGQNMPGKNSLIKSSVEPAGLNCSNGGIKFEVGLDLNNNSILDPSEINETKFVCNGAPGLYDKQVLLVIWNTGTGGAGTSGTFIRGNLPKFNKKNYGKVDSISYVIRAQAQPTGSFELYNLTDNLPIQGSLITTQSSSPVNLTSNNLVDKFPDKDIDLGIRVNGHGGNATIWDNVYLVIYRRL